MAAVGPPRPGGIGGPALRSRELVPPYKYLSHPTNIGIEVMAMTVDPRAGKPAAAEMLLDVARLEREYYQQRPDADDPRQQVSFGTSGHRGTPLCGSFTEAHILAITQALCEYRRRQGITGPLFLGKDTHAISPAAERTALEVLSANGVETMIQADDGFTPTPVISHAILSYNRGRREGLADGIVVTPSHNPPEDGGFKYNAANGGPADTDVTAAVGRRANEILKAGNRDVRRLPPQKALQAATTHPQDYALAYVRDLAAAIDMDAIRGAGLKLGVDPLGGASAGYWEPINRLYGLAIEVVNPRIDPTFSFMPVDHDGKIRMDCSSPYAMSNLVALRERFQVAFGNDPDADRHGIVTPSAGLMNPNHYLAVAIRYLLGHRPQWPAGAAVGKTLVSSAIIDRVVAHSAGSSARCRWASSGSRPACSTGAAVSAARRAPGPASSAATARSGPPTRTACCWTFWPPRSPRGPAGTRASTTARSRPSSATRSTPASMRRQPPTEGPLAAALAGEDPRRRACRRADPGQADPGSRQRRADRRAEDRGPERLVRGAAIRHGRRLQAVCREFQGPGPPRPDRPTGPATGGRGVSETLSPFAPRKWAGCGEIIRRNATFAERKATLIYSPIVSSSSRRWGSGRCGCRGWRRP